MATYRPIVMMAVLGGFLLASCGAPAAPTAVPTQIVAPTALPVQPAATVQPTIPAAATQPAATQPAATAVPTKPAAAPTKPAASGAQTPGPSTKLNMDEIFPPGPGRQEMLDNCTTCHTFVPMVVLQMSQSLWDTNALGHRDRVPRMSDADYKLAYEYLAKNFNPDKPVPVLPQELLNFWTDY
jgi:hypothetical protein